MGYVSNTDANTTGAASFRAGQEELSNFNKELLKDLETIENDLAPVADKANAYKFISEFFNKTGTYSNLIGDDMEKLRASVMTDVTKELKDQSIRMPIDRYSPNFVQVYYDNKPATALDIVQHFFDTKDTKNYKPFTFGFEQSDTTADKNGIETYGHINVPWSNTPLDELTNTTGQSMGDKNLKGDCVVEGIEVHVCNERVCAGTFKVTASAPASAIAGYLNTTNKDPSFDFKAKYLADLQAAGFGS